MLTDRLKISWRLVLRDGSLITPETELPSGARVEALWHTGPDGAMTGTFSFSGIPDVEYIHFPCVFFENFPASGKLLLPDQYGVVLKNVMQHVIPAGEQWLFSAEPQIAASEMVTMRASAIMTDEQSYLIDFRDDTWRQKRCFYVTPSPGTLLFYGEHLVPMEPGMTAYTLPFPCGITLFCGGWFQAAKLYRKWAVKQHWVTAKKPRSAVRDISCMCWNRGESSHVVPPVLRLSRDTGTGAGLSWYWWHHNPYDTDYPDFWPPREGVETFRNAIGELTANGNYVHAYLNGMTWDMDGSAVWDGAQDAVVRRRDGSPEAIPYNVFNRHRLASICGSSAGFRKCIEREVGFLAGSGISGVYLDMIGNANHRPCYHPGHGHPSGGGDYHYHGYRTLVDGLRRKYPDLIFSTEDCGEDFMDLMDLFIGLHICHERFYHDPDQEHVPAYNAIYHGIMPVYGSCTFPDGIPPYDPAWPQDGKWKKEEDWLKLYPDQVFLELARQIVYGNIPTVANLQLRHCTDPQFAEVYGFLCRTVRFYYDNRSCLFDGEMLEPPDIDCPELDVDFMTRSIYTKEGQMKPVRRRRKTVFASRWKRPDGTEAAILANWSRQTVRLLCDGREMTMEPRSYAILEKERSSEIK